MDRTVELIPETTGGHYAWWPVRLDAGRAAGRWIWLKHYFSHEHLVGHWRDACSLEPRPDRYVDGRPIEFVIGCYDGQ